MSYTKTFFIGDVEFEVEFSSTPYRPAKISGPPENCYPAEGGEVELESISIGGFEVTEVLSDAAYNKIKTMCEEAASECEKDARDQALEDEAEAKAFDRECY